MGDANVDELPLPAKVINFDQMEAPAPLPAPVIPLSHVHRQVARNKIVQRFAERAQCRR